MNTAPVLRESQPTDNGSSTGVPTTPLRSRLDEAIFDERRQALRSLLSRPLLSAAGPDPEQYRFVRRHAEWLREWFHRHCGWSLQIDREAARLRKTPADVSDQTRPAIDPKNGTPFTRRRYVLLCLALAALERSDRQTVLGKLAEDILALASADPALANAGIRFDLRTMDQRRDLVAVMRLLLHWQVLIRVHGDEQQFLSESGDVLYTINRPVLAALLNVQRGPSTITEDSFEARLAAIVDEPLADSDDARNQRTRHRLMRRLLDDSVVYWNELNEAERSYLQNQRARLQQQITEAVGLEPEVRGEGMAMVDESAGLTDLEMPEEGTDGHVALLVAEYLAGEARRNPGQVVSLAALRDHVARLSGEHGSHWRKEAREPGAESWLVDHAVDRLEALRLLRPTTAGVLPLPAIGRYALGQAVQLSQNTTVSTQQRLWGIED